MQRGLVLVWVRIHWTTALPGVMPLCRGRTRQYKAHAQSYTWQILLFIAGSAFPTVTLICSVLSLSAHWAANAPQGYKLTGCVSIMYSTCGTELMQDKGRDRVRWQEEDRGIRKTKWLQDWVDRWACSVNVFCERGIFSDDLQPGSRI